MQGEVVAQGLIADEPHFFFLVQVGLHCEDNHVFHAEVADDSDYLGVGEQPQLVRSESALQERVEAWTIDQLALLHKQCFLRASDDSSLACFFLWRALWLSELLLDFLGLLRVKVGF